MILASDWLLNAAMCSASELDQQARMSQKNQRSKSPTTE